MLLIRQTLNALPGLNRTDKAVLIEVCQLAERGGWCTARNEYLIEALASNLRTITRRLAVLQQRGWLLIEGAGKARRLAPTPALRACYAAPDEADRQAAIAALNLADSRQSATANLATSRPEPSHYSPANLATSAPEPSQSGQVGAGEPSHFAQANLATSRPEPSHFGSRVYGDPLDQVKTHPSPACVGAGEREAFQKKIAALEDENRLLKAKIQELVPPVAEPPHQPAVGQAEGPRHSDASKALAREMAGLWNLSEVGAGRQWMALARFTHLMELAGRLAEVSRQFTGYALYRQKRGIEPYNFDKYLGSEGGGYRGEWCAYDWPAKAREARANGETPVLTPAPRVATRKPFLKD